MLPETHFVLLSHEITPLSGLAIAKLAEQIGLPKGVFNVITGRGRVAGQRLVEHPDTALVTMTGSTRAGREIIRSGAKELKVIRLELGGKAPFIVMEDANVDKAVSAAMTARYTNCGQVCTCNERMYLHDQIADEFLEKFVARSRELSIGDPMGEVDLGPKVSGAEVAKIQEIVARGTEAGADVLLAGGTLKDGIYAKGHWVAPTVMEVNTNASPLLQEEIFGPRSSGQTCGWFRRSGGTGQWHCFWAFSLHVHAERKTHCEDALRFEVWRDLPQPEQWRSRSGLPHRMGSFGSRWGGRQVRFRCLPEKTDNLSELGVTPIIALELKWRL